MDLGGRDSKSPKKFLIPKVSRSQTKGFQRLLEPESIPGKSITALIEGSVTLKEKFKWSSHWSLRTITQVCNSNFQQRFLEKKVELLKEVKQFKEYFAYGLTQSDTEANNICSNGAFAGQILNFPLGDVEHGVNVCQYPDVLLRWAEKKGFKHPCIVIYKILKGRCKTVNARTSSKQQMVEPTPNLEYHIANGTPTPEEPLFMQLSKSQLFLYEYDDDALPAKHPRHCLPYAVISLRKRTQSPPLPPLTDKEQSRSSASKTSRDLASTELDRNNNRRKVKVPADLPTVGKISKMSAHSKPTSRNPQENQSYVTSGMESLDNDEKKTGATKNLTTMENEAQPEVRMKLSDRFAPTSSAMDDPKLDSLRQEHLKMLEKLKAVRVERMNNSLLGFGKTSQDEQRFFKNEHLKTVTTNCSSNKPEATPKTVPQLSSLKITINNDTREQITSSNSSVGKNTQVSADQIPHNNSERLSDRSEGCVSHRSNKNRNRTTNYQTQAPFRCQNKTFRNATRFFGPRGGSNNMSYRGVAQRGRNRAGFLNRRRMPFYGSQDFKRYNRTHNFNMGEQHEHVGSFNQQTRRAWRGECPSDYYSHNEQDSAHFMQGGSNFRDRGKRMPRRACRERFVQCSNPRIQPLFPKPRFQNNRKQRSMKQTETFRLMRDSSNNSSKIDSSVLSCQHSVGNTVETSKRQLPTRASLTDVGGHNHDKESAQSDLDDYESSPSQHETLVEPGVEEIRSGLKRNGKYCESAKVEISDQPCRGEFIGLYDNISSGEESCVKTLCVDDLELQDMDYDSGESLSAKLPQTGGSQIDPNPTLHCNLSSQTNNTPWEHGDLATEQQHYTLNNTSHPNSNSFAYRFPKITGIQRLQSRTPCVGPSSSYGCQPNGTQQNQTGEQLISEQAHRVPTEFFEQHDSYSSHAQQLQTDDSTNLMTTTHGCESWTTESPQAYVPNGPVQEPSNMQNSYAPLQNNFSAHSYASQTPTAGLNESTNQLFTSPNFGSVTGSNSHSQDFLPCPSKMPTSNAEVKPDTALPNSLSNIYSNAQNYPTGEQTNWIGQEGVFISTAQHRHAELDALTPTFSGSPYSDMSISMSMSKGSKEGICPPDLLYDVGCDSFINNPHMLASTLEYCSKNYKQAQARRNSQGSCTSRVSMDAQQLQTDDSTNLMTTTHGCESWTTESPQAYVPNGHVQEPSNMQNSYAPLQNIFSAHSYASQTPTAGLNESTNQLFTSPNSGSVTGSNSHSQDFLPCPSKMPTSNAEVKPDTALPNSLSNMDSNAQNYPTGEQTNWIGQEGVFISTAQHPHAELDALTPTFSGSPYSDMSISMSMSKGSKDGICPPDLPYDVGSDSLINNPHMLASTLEYCSKNYKQAQARRNSQGSCTSRVSMDAQQLQTDDSTNLMTTTHGCESWTTESPQAHVPNGPVQEPSNMQNSYAPLQNNFSAHSYASQAPTAGLNESTNQLFTSPNSGSVTGSNSHSQDFLPCPSKMPTSNAEVKPDTALPNSLSNMDSNAQNYPTGEQTNWIGQEGVFISTAQHPHAELDALTPTFSGSPYSDMSISMSMSKGSKEGICPPDFPYDVGSDSFINNPHMLASTLEYCSKNYKQAQARRNSQGSCTSRVSMDEVEAPTESKQKLFYGSPLITKKGGKPCEVLLDNIPGLPKPVDPRAALSALFGRRFQIELKQVNFSSDFSSESEGVNAIKRTTVTQTTERKCASGRQNSRDPRLINNKVKKDTNKGTVLTAGIASEVYSSTNLVTAAVQPNQDSSGLESVQSFLEPQKGNGPGNMPLLTPNESAGHRTSFICSSEKPTISNESSHDTLITSNPLELESCAEAQPNPDNQPVATIKSEALEDVTHYIPEISVDNQVPERKSAELHLLGKIALKVRKLRHGLNAPKPSSSEQPPKPNDANTSSFLLQKLKHVSGLDVGMHPKPSKPVNHDDGTEQESKCLSDKRDSSSESSNNVSCRGISSINPSPGESCEQCAIRRLSPLKGSNALCNKSTSSASSCTSSIGMENQGNSRLSPLSSSVQEERSTSQGSTTCERNQLSSEISCDLTARRRSLPSRSTSKYSESRSNRRSRSPRRRSRSPCRRSRSPIQSSRSPTRSSISPRRRSRSPRRRSRSPWRGSRSPRRRSRSPWRGSRSPRRRSRSPRRRSKSPHSRGRSPRRTSRSPRRRGRSPRRRSRSPRRRSRSPTRRSRSPRRRSRSLSQRRRSPRSCRGSRSQNTRNRSPISQQGSSVMMGTTQLRDFLPNQSEAAQNCSFRIEVCQDIRKVIVRNVGTEVLESQCANWQEYRAANPTTQNADFQQRNI
ncbi:uncharacterized protein [Asterias amurensis]|uniref:uncharacterized protein n=1 Tax=Asterias amurensis TaxID=7602 RepID=UPI003AB11197